MELCIREVDDCAGVGTFRHSRVGGNPEIQAVKKRLDPRIREGDERERGWRKRRASVTKATMGRPLSVIPA